MLCYSLEECWSKESDLDYCRYRGNQEEQKVHESGEENIQEFWVHLWSCGGEKET